jgi:hypothetical protein
MPHGRSIEGRPRGRLLGDRIRAVHVRVNRCDDDPGFNRNQVDADHRHPHPGVDHNPFVENVIEHVDHAGVRRNALQFGHIVETKSVRRHPAVTGSYTSTGDNEALQYDIAELERLPAT